MAETESRRDETQMLPFDDPDERQDRRPKSLKLVGLKPSHGSQDLAWHDELQAGMSCPSCQRYRLQRSHSTVFCHFCRQRWWSHRSHR